MNSTRLERTLSVVGHLAHHHEGQTLSQLASALDLPVSSMHDLLHALVEIDVVRTPSPRTYALGPRAVALGLAVADSVELRAVAQPILRSLAHDLSETISLAVRQGDEVVYADRYEVAAQPTSVLISLGEARPLHSSSAGKLLAAHDPELEKNVVSSPSLTSFSPATLTDRNRLREEYAKIRRQGFSLSDGEYVEGIRGLSTPVVDAGGVVVAAVQTVAPIQRLSDDRIADIVTRMSDAAAMVSSLLGAGSDIIPQIDFDD